MTNKRVIFITGGAGGIGLCTAKKFGAHGYAIALNDYRQENGDKALQELQALGIEAALFIGDVTKEASVNALVAQVIAHFGRRRCRSSFGTASSTSTSPARSSSRAPAFPI
jgi:NAD(P)-dependent dehydrogenase (short-subunit alcohol dehydrogenase family)